MPHSIQDVCALVHAWALRGHACALCAAISGLRAGDIHHPHYLPSPAELRIVGGAEGHLPGDPWLSPSQSFLSPVCATGLSLAELSPVLPSREEDLPQLPGGGRAKLPASCRRETEAPVPARGCRSPGGLFPEKALLAAQSLRIPPLAAVGLGKPRPSGSVAAVGRARGLANPLRQC